MSAKINFNSKTPPTQKQFNEYHVLPVNYGEDGEQLVGWNYTKEQATQLFTDDWVEKTGEEPDFDIANSVVEGLAGWYVQPDPYEDGDFCFAMVYDKTGDAVRFYKAWRLWL